MLKEQQEFPIGFWLSSTSENNLMFMDYGWKTDGFFSSKDNSQAWVK